MPAPSVALLRRLETGVAARPDAQYMRSWGAPKQEKNGFENAGGKMVDLI
jgi:hypothetical protein